jgi:hypothetical protein
MAVGVPPSFVFIFVALGVLRKVFPACLHLGAGVIA